MRELNKISIADKVPNTVSVVFSYMALDKLVTLLEPLFSIELGESAGHIALIQFRYKRECMNTNIAHSLQRQV